MIFTNLDNGCLIDVYIFFFFVRKVYGHERKAAGYLSDVSVYAMTAADPGRCST